MYLKYVCSYECLLCLSLFSLSALLFLGFLSLPYLLASAVCNLVIFPWILKAEKQSV